MLPKVYQWFVVRGRAAIRSEDGLIWLELDPEGSACCVLSAQDAHEIAQILTQEARTLWEACRGGASVAAKVEGDPASSCRMALARGTLQAVVHATQPLIALSLDAGSDCQMDVSQAVALVQVLQHMVATLGDRQTQQ